MLSHVALAAALVVPAVYDKIAFVRIDATQNDVWIMNPDGTGQTNLTNTVAQEGGPSWSPDGTKIVFHSDRDGDDDIYVMNADGTNPTQLTNVPSAEGFPAWSPNGDVIAFVTERHGPQEIYVMNEDGTNPVRLTNNSFDERRPAWSPDGNHIAFTSTRDGQLEIYVMDPDGANQTRLTFDGENDAPAWSPDGALIAYETFTGSRYEIFVMDADGTDAVSISAATGSDTAPTWAPDGTRIAFERGFAEIYVVALAGGAQTNISQTPAGSDSYWPRWGPLPFDPDADDDGIYDVVDTAPATPSTAFSDVPNGGRTAGRVLSIPGNSSRSTTRRSRPACARSSPPPARWRTTRASRSRSTASRRR
jgi:Tol biopolymer transport system component